MQAGCLEQLCLLYLFLLVSGFVFVFCCCSLFCFCFFANFNMSEKSARFGKGNKSKERDPKETKLCISPTGQHHNRALITNITEKHIFYMFPSFF